jgi:tetratricopeptide (TPR) repeat protein
VLPGARRGASLRAAPTRRKGAGGKRGRAAEALVPVPPAMVVGAGVVALVALWPLTAPLRADASADQALRHAAAGRFDAADAAWERAASTAFWEPAYPARHGDFRATRGDQEGARALHEVAQRRDPRGLQHAINVGRLAVRVRDEAAAAAAYERALEIDPSTPQVLAEVGRFHLDHGDDDLGRRLLERAVILEPDEPDWWIDLGDARAEAGDTVDARSAFEEALRLDPQATGARNALEELPDSPAAGS